MPERRSSFKAVSPWLFAAGFALCGALNAAPLAPPEGLRIVEGPTPRFEWDAVEGAELYRVAVFDALDADGKRGLLAAVWVRGLAWDYARGEVLPKAGKLASTKPAPLPHGRTLRVMVSSARAEGADKSEWAGADFSVSAPPHPSPTPTPTVAALAPAADPSGDAEIELVGGEEFQRSPEPALIDVQEAAEAGNASAEGPLSIVVETPQPASLATARGLLKGGDADAAEIQFRELLKADKTNADHWEGLGDALLARRMKAEAYEAYSQALLLDGERKHLREWIKVNVPRR
jgi:tetratricopeptide (TPR) repeat protein